MGKFTQSVLNVSEGGGSIPPITEADEGKVLTVDDGAASWQTSSGGESPLVLIEYNPDDMEINKSYNDRNYNIVKKHPHKHW